MLLRQSYDNLQKYGKEPEDLRNVLNGFTVVLKDLRIEYVTDAFHTWLRSRREFPSPSDIRTLALDAKEVADSRRNSSVRYTGIVWTQVIRDRDGDHILGEYPQGQHKSDFELSQIFKGKRVSVTMRREG
jgi:hypothetical protein